MFIGIAPDHDPDWSYLKGGYIAYATSTGCGFYVDGFGSRPGWISNAKIKDFFESHRDAMALDFIMRMDMPNGRLSCLTLEEEELGSVELDILETYVRFFANVSAPGHSVRIIG